MLRKNIIIITKFVKTKSLNNTTHTLRNPLRYVLDRKRGWEKRVTKDRKGMLITEKLRRTTKMNTMLTATVFHGRNPINKTLR
jgi:hypothetical protein